MLRASRIVCRHRCQHPLVKHFSSAPSSFQFPQISKEAQRALWAQKMIQTIAFPDEDNNLGASLRDKVINCEIPNNEFNFDQETKQEVLRMFKDGIELHPLVFTQGRIRDASTRANKAVFCPNRLITSKMFEILQSPKKHSLIIDSCQAGKTFSILAYIHLSRFIHQYIYEATCSQNAKLKDQYKMLRRNSHLFPGTKLWYWSINQAQYQRPDFSLKKIIIAQATELPDLQKCEQIDQLVKKIKQNYKETEINHMPMIDQVNQLASLMREWNQLYDKNKDNQTAGLGRQANSQAFRINEDIQKFRNIASVVTSLIINSSANIEQALLYKNQQNLQESGRLSLDFKKSKEELVSNQSLNFHKDILKQWGSNDFWDFFWFEISEHLQPNSKVQDRKNEFLKEVRKYEIKNYYTFLEIRLFLANDRERMRKFNEILKDKIDQKQLEKLIIEFDEQCIKICVKRIKEQFLSKGNGPLQMEFLRATYILALKNIADDCKEFVVAYEQIEPLMKDSSSTLHSFLQQINQHKNVIPMSLNENKSVQFLWGPKAFSKIIQRVMIQERECHKIPQKRFESKKLYFGRKLEGLIIQQLDKDAIIKFFNFNLLTPAFKKTDDFVPLKRYGVEAEHKFEIRNLVKFTPFPVKQDQYANFGLQKSIQALISSCCTYKNVWSAAVPQDYKNQKSSTSNIPNVDFILAKRKDIKAYNRFLIYCVDIALTRKAVEGRGEKAIEMYKKFFGKYYSPRQEYQMIHLIVCPKDLCLDSFRKNGNTYYTVKYSAIEMLKIEETKWKDQKYMFEALQQYMSLNHEI